MKDGKCVLSSSISQVEIIIIAAVSTAIVVLILVACGVAYYYKRNRRVLIHEAVTRSQMAL